MREAYSRSTYKPSRRLRDLTPAQKNEPVITIVWHLRLGDIVLHSDKEHFDRLASQIASALEKADKLPVHVFFLGENDALGAFPFVVETCTEFFKGNCSYPAMDAKETLYRMVESDVLVTSGSSFSAIAALFRTDGIVLYEFPKENVLGIYEVSEQGLIAPNGAIAKPSMKELEHRLRIIFNRQVETLRIGRPRSSLS
jgi:hypothetical protein